MYFYYLFLLLHLIQPKIKKSIIRCLDIRILLSRFYLVSILYKILFFIFGFSTTTKKTVSN